MTYFFIFFYIFTKITSFSSTNVPTSCCPYLQQSHELISCLENNSFIIRSPPSSDSLPPSSNDILFLVFASRNIYHYASLTLLINSHYTHSHNYDLLLLTEEFNDYYPADRRWNKIAGVLEILNLYHGPESKGTAWGKDYKYVIAMDADLIILDLAFNINSIIQNHPQGNIFLSADTSDIANTGFMIIKNTKWSRTFFETWYESRHLFDCDQHAFNDFYSKLQGTNSKSKHRVIILQSKEINSLFPIYATYEDTDPILHLMGERDNIRYKIFQYAAESYCWDYLIHNDPFYELEKDEEGEEKEEEEEAVEHHQRNIRYGINHGILSNIAKEELLIPINQQYSLCYDILYDAPPDHVLRKKRSEEFNQELIEEINNCFTILHSLTSDLCTAGKNIIQNHRECNDLYNKNYQLAKKGLQLVPIAQLNLYDHMSRNLYDSFLLMESSIEALEIAEEVLNILRIMTQLIPSSEINLRRFLLYRRSIALSQICYVAIDVNQMDKGIQLAEESLRLALELYETNIPTTHADYETYIRCVITAYRVLGSMIAPEPSRRNEAIEFFKRAIQITQDLLSITRRESNQIHVMMKDNLISLLRGHALNANSLEVLNTLKELKKYRDILSEDDLESVTYFQNTFNSIETMQRGHQQEL